MEVTSLGTTVVVPVTDGSQVGEARRTAVRVGHEVGLPESEIGKLAIVATEAAGNVARYGGGGVLLLRVLQPGAPGLEVLALDRGPGMADVSRSLEDGHSTSGTAGTGLGAIRRLSASCEVYSAPGAGTALLSRIVPDGVEEAQAMDIGAVSLPARGETVCGDAWVVMTGPARTVAVLADGLGHGPLAAVAATLAVRSSLDNFGQDASGILAAAHEALRSTRGAAVGVAVIDTVRRTLSFAGVGNIAGTILGDGRPRSLVSHGGIVGHEVHKIREFNYPWPEGSLLVLNSDGIASQWKLDGYPGLRESHPALIAGVLYRDFTRGRDDATVIALREAR